MKRSYQHLREVVEIWPYLSSSQKWRFFFIAMWWARVKKPARQFANHLRLTPGERYFLIWAPVIILCCSALLIFAKAYSIAGPGWWLPGLTLASAAALLGAKTASKG